jgi:hypothetical protein
MTSFNHNRCHIYPIGGNLKDAITNGNNVNVRHFQLVETEETTALHPTKLNFYLNYIA